MVPVYKLVLATRLVDGGLYERALAYVEQAARAAAAAPRDYSPRLVASLAELADRLKYHDPALHEDGAGEEGAEGSPRHQQWLDDVKHAAHMLQVEAASQQVTPQHHTDYYAQQQQQQEQHNHQQYSWDQAHQYQQQQQQQEQTPPAQPYVEPEETAADYAAQYYPPAAPPAEPEAPPQYYEDWRRTEEHHAQAYAEPSYWRGDQPYGYGEAEGAPEENPRPMITMPGAAAAHYRDYDDDRPPSAEQQNDRDTDTPTKQEGKGREAAKGDEKGDGKGRGSGWFGGIFSKLSLRAPQANLPDDKNPRIVWDEDTKRWKNLDEDEADGGDQPPPPPPKMADLAAQIQQQQQQSIAGAAPPAAGAAAPPVSNIFKMQKGRHIKKSYVDVFNPGGAARALPPAAAVLGPAPALQPAPAYFVPPDHSGGYEYEVGDGQLRSGI